MKNLVLVLFLLPMLLLGQSKKQKKVLAAQQKETQQVINHLKNHVTALQQLFTNEHAEDSIAQYINNQFKSVGLVPKEGKGYLQKEWIDEGKQIDTATFLKVNGHQLQVNNDFFPLPFSANKMVSGMPAIALREKNLPWFIDLKDLLNSKKPTENDAYKVIREEAARAAKKGATALFVYSTGSQTVAYLANDGTPAVTIPVVYISPTALQKYFPDNADILDIEMNVQLHEWKYEVTNVLGYIDNGAASTILISTIFPDAKKGDSVKQKNSVNQIAMLFQWAEKMAATKLKGNNYLLAAFAMPSLRDSFAVKTSNLLLDIRLDMLVNLPYDDFGAQMLVMDYLVKGPEPDSGNGQSTWNSDDALSISVVKDPTKRNMPALLVVKQNNSVLNAERIGILTDEKYEGEGLKIKKLIPGKLCEDIGLQKGDILTFLGSNGLLNIQSYKQVLSQYNPGDSTTLKIVRNGAEKVFNIVF